MVDYENKLNQLEEKKNNYAMTWFRKQICLSSNLTDKNNTLEEKNSYLWSRRK